MCWPCHCVPSPEHTPLFPSKPLVTEHFTHCHRVRAQSLYSVALAGAP